MPWIGSSPNQQFSRTDGVRTGDQTWTEAAAVPVGIAADAHDTHDTDIADGLSACLKRDGGTTPTADLAMGGFKLTGAGSASARGDLPLASQVQDASLIAATDSGTDTRTASLSPAVTAYATGMLLVLKATSANTGSATINVNSVGAKTVKKGKTGSSNLDAGDIGAGAIGLYAYDGTNLQKLNAPEFPSGTRMLFQQTAAPTGWTKDTTHNDKAIRIVSGTASSGGSVAFTTAFASKTPTGTVGGTAITIAQMPLHGHPYRAADGFNNNDTSGGLEISSLNQVDYPAYTGAPVQGKSQLIGGTGGGGSHDHTWTGNAMDFAVQYVDAIIAAKD